MIETGNEDKRWNEHEKYGQSMFGKYHADQSKQSEIGLKRIGENGFFVFPNCVISLYHKSKPFPLIILLRLSLDQMGEKKKKNKKKMEGVLSLENGALVNEQMTLTSTIPRTQKEGHT